MAVDRFLIDLAGTGKSTFKIGANYAVDTSRQLIAGAGLTGGGTLASDRTFALAASGVTAASYGDASHVATIVVDQYGRITSASSTAITPAGIGAAAASHTQTWSTITVTPTTLAGYGITDAVSSADSRLTNSRAPNGTAGGDLTGSYPNPTLATSGVAAGTYGDSTHVPILVLDAKGRVTGVTLATITGGVPSGSAGGDLLGSTYPNPVIANGVVSNAKLVNSSLTVTAGTGLTGGGTVALGGTTSLAVAYGTIAGTAAAGNDSRLSDSRAPTGSAGGSLTGTYPNPTIAAGAVVDAMVSGTAAIAWSKISKSGALPADIGAAAASHTQAFSTITSTPTTVAGYGITNAALNTVTVTGTNSLAGGGALSSNQTLTLLNDVSTPGASFYYGTNGSGTKGWFVLPSSTSGAPVGASYVVIALDATLTSERALAVANGITLTDGGANGNATLGLTFGTLVNTVCQGNDARLSDTRTPSGAAGGDLIGTYPNPTISSNTVLTRLNGNTTIALTAPIAVATGAVTVSTPALSATQTWNNAAIAFTGLKLNATDTASAAGTLLIDLQVGSVSKWKVDKSGNATAAGTLAVAGATTLSSTLAVTGAVTLSSTLAITGALTAASMALAAGTVIVSTPIESWTETWNAGAVVFTALKLNVTNTASAAGSLLMDLQVGGTSQWKVDKTGAVTALGGITSTTAAFSGAVNVGGNVTITNASLPTLTINNTTTASSSWALKHLANGDLQIIQPSQNNWITLAHASGKITSIGPVLISDATASTSNITGALVVTGGIASSGNSYFSGGTINFTSGTVSSSTTTGNLVVAGGAGIGGALNVGGAIAAAGTIRRNGSASTDVCFATYYTGSTFAYFVAADGTLNWGPSTSAVDTTLARNGVGLLQIAGGLSITTTLAITGTTTAAAINASGVITQNGAASGAAFVLDGSAATFRSLWFFTGGAQRWRLFTDNTAESGANAGSAFSLNAYTDASALIDSPISIVRAAGGAMTLSRPTSITNATASSSTTTGSLVVTGGVGIGGALNVGGAIKTTATGVVFYGSNGAVTSIVSRWQNTGGDFYVGLESSTPGSFFTGSLAYDATFYAGAVGLYLNSGAQIRFGISGTEKMRLNSSGGLELRQTATNSNIGQGTGWIWTSDGTSAGTIRGGIYAQSAGTLNLFGGSSITTHLEITAGGNVLIGTTTDDAANKLQVVSGTAATGVIVKNTAGASRLTIDDATAGGGSDRQIYFTNSVAGNKTNWRAGAQITVNNGFEIGHSTAAGGATYTTDLSFDSTGAASFASSIKSTSPTAGIGYATGAGGTVTQATSKATGVTLSTVCGTITLNAASLAATTSVTFTWTNTAIAVTDYIDIQHDSVGTLGAYSICVTPGAGSATVTVRNNTAGALAEAIVLRFFVTKAVTA